MPPRPRPNEIAWWFKHGCRQLNTPKDLPSIESIEDFETTWVGWWKAIQPGWRGAWSWPFSREGDEDPAEQCWDALPNGGKDGLFIVVLSLGWWIGVQDPLEESKVDEAVEDVTWVIDNLVTFLCADATNPHSDDDDDPHSSANDDSHSNADTDSTPDSHTTRPPMPQRKQLQKKQPQRKPVQRKQSQKKWSGPLKIGPPSKRARRTRA